MTYATNDSRETTSITEFFEPIRTALRGRINAIRTERAARKALKSVYYYHSEKAATLAQAQRDVNRVWLG